MLLPLMGSFVLYSLDRCRNRSASVWLCAGALSALALFYKYTVLPLLACLWLLWAIEKWRATRDWRVFSRFCGSTLLGFSLTALVILSPFLIRDGGKHLWECTVLFNRSYTASATFSLDSLYTRMNGFWQHWRVLFFLPLLLLIREPARIRVWLAILGAAFISTAGSCYQQYYVLVMPFWALICAVALVNFCRFASRGVVPLQLWSGRLLAAGVVLLLCLPDLSFVQPGGWPSAKLNPCNPFTESLVVAKRLAELTDREDRVYVAGSEPQILYYARRWSSTRFIIAYPFMIPGPLAEHYQAEAMADLKRHSPAMIVRAVSNTSWLDQEGTPTLFRFSFGSFLEANYECIGGYVQGEGTNYWAEPVSKKDTPRASLLVYRLKRDLTTAQSLPRALP